MTNEGNNCFWWCLTILLNQNSSFDNRIIDLRRPKQLNDLPLQMCLSRGCDYSQMVNIIDIPTIMNTLCDGDSQKTFNLVILDMNNLHAFNTIVNINPSILSKTNYMTDIRYFLLHDNNHFSPILDIKKFFNVRGFCVKCQQAFLHSDAFIKHECQTEVDDTDSDDDGDDDVEHVKRVSIKEQTHCLKSALKVVLKKDLQIFLSSNYNKVAQSIQQKHVFLDTFRGTLKLNKNQTKTV
jgi:hypothetical protein